MATSRQRQRAGNGISVSDLPIRNEQAVRNEQAMATSRQRKRAGNGNEQATATSRQRQRADNGIVERNGLSVEEYADERTN